MELQDDGAATRGGPPLSGSHGADRQSSPPEQTNKETDGLESKQSECDETPVVTTGSRNQVCRVCPAAHGPDATALVMFWSGPDTGTQLVLSPDLITNIQRFHADRC